jgi:hypothetical protein
MIAHTPLGAPGTQMPLVHAASLEHGPPAATLGMHPAPGSQYVVLSGQPHVAHCEAGAAEHGTGVPSTQAYPGTPGIPGTPGTSSSPGVQGSKHSAPPSPSAAHTSPAGHEPLGHVSLQYP